jgi:hypothetical protein
LCKHEQFLVLTLQYPAPLRQCCAVLCCVLCRRPHAAFPQARSREPCRLGSPVLVLGPVRSVVRPGASRRRGVSLLRQSVFDRTRERFPPTAPTWADVFNLVAGTTARRPQRLPSSARVSRLGQGPSWRAHEPLPAFQDNKPLQGGRTPSLTPAENELDCTISERETACILRFATHPPPTRTRTGEDRTRLHLTKAPAQSRACRV